MLVNIVLLFLCLQTEKDWDKVRNSKEGKKMTEEHQEMLKGMKTSYLNNLDILMGRKPAVACEVYIITGQEHT